MPAKKIACACGCGKRIVSKLGPIKYARGHKRRPIIFGEIAIVPLSRGMNAIIDAKDSEIVSGNDWSAYRGRKTFYASCQRNKKYIGLHNLITGIYDRWVDHKDGNGLNNRRSNLRPASPSQNGANVKSFRSKSGFIGVQQLPSGRWSASITVNRKSIYLGCFPSKEDAAMARDAASVKYFGEFAALNFRT